MDEFDLEADLHPLYIAIKLLANSSDLSHKFPPFNTIKVTQEATVPDLKLKLNVKIKYVVKVSSLNICSTIHI